MPDKLIGLLGMVVGGTSFRQNGDRSLDSFWMMLLVRAIQATIIAVSVFVTLNIKMANLETKVSELSSTVKNFGMICQKVEDSSNRIERLERTIDVMRR